jgi:hypothetical protein
MLVSVLTVSNCRFSILATSCSSKSRSQTSRRTLISTYITSLNNGSTTRTFTKGNFGHNVRVIHNGTAIVTDSFLDIGRRTFFIRTCALWRKRSSFSAGSHCLTLKRYRSVDGTVITERVGLRFGLRCRLSRHSDNHPTTPLC